MPKRRQRAHGPIPGSVINWGPEGVGGSGQAAEELTEQRAVRCSGREADLRLGETSRPAPQRNWVRGAPLGLESREPSPGGPSNRDKQQRAGQDGARELMTVALPWPSGEPGVGPRGPSEWW
ncbi:hypothetical protein NDU88_003782 [Pleurodeles waltl]|uniref:Uncharacterized protein n=1 Tax=Pleurodeles waltl TaxID=8319 RepID=A0AAV7WTP2_PLEWA|nr:hypothetical protein NDU88_003782 [Pleurodeles waltl]